MRQSTIQKVITVKKKLRDLAASTLHRHEQDYLEAQAQTQEAIRAIEIIMSKPIDTLSDFFLREEEQRRALKAAEQAHLQEEKQKQIRDKQKRVLQECARNLATSEAAYENFLDNKSSLQAKTEQQANDERRGLCEFL